MTLTKWEYQVWTNVDDEFLNNLGAIGWELTAIVDGYIFYFRRMLVENES